MGKAMFKGADGKMVGLKNVLWVPKLAANLITVRRLQKAGMDTSSKGAKTYTARLGERILWDLQEDRDVYNEMWKNPVVPMPKERQVAASINTKGEAFGSGDDTNGRAKEIKSKKFNLGVSSKLAEHEGSGAAAQKQHKGEENPKAAAEEEYEESIRSTTTSQSSLVNGGEEATDADDEEEEVQQVCERAPTLPSRTTSATRIRVTPQQCQGLHVPAAEEEGRGKRRIQAPNRLTYDALGKPAKSALAGVALIVGDDEESDYEKCAFAFFSPVEMPGEPATLNEALESSDAEEWKKAMESELKIIEENGTWELVELPEGRKAITSKWLFKIKSDADGKIEYYKSRLVAKGYQQKEKVDFKE
ncbi:unnamed protein product [Closterium sp. NIES-53]